MTDTALHITVVRREGKIFLRVAGEQQAANAAARDFGDGDIVAVEAYRRAVAGGQAQGVKRVAADGIVVVGVVYRDAERFRDFVQRDRAGDGIGVSRVV